MKGKGLVTFLSYIAIGLVAIALVLAKIFSALSLSSGLVSAMTLIAQVIAYESLRFSHSNMQERARTLAG